MGIGVVGMPGSGKSILSDAARSLGLKVIVMGDMVREETSRRGLPLTPQNVMRVAEDLRKEHGMGAVAMLVIEKIKRMSAKETIDTVVVEGLRSPEECRIFREFFDWFVLIAVHASPSTRHRRIILRRRADDARAREVLMERDKRELMFGIGELLALADYHLVNENKSKEEFYRECVELLRKIIEARRNHSVS